MINPLPGLPLIESPLFPELKAGLHLTAEEERIATELFEKGYAVLEFPDPELDSRTNRIKSSLGSRFAIDFSDPEADKTLAERRIQDAWTFNEDVRAIAANKTILRILSKLWGRSAFPFQTLNFPVGTQQEAHSDAVHFSSIPERFMCGVWLAMEDVAPEAGPLLYYPRSHRWPIMVNGLVGRRGYGHELESAQTPYQTAWSALAKAYSAKPELFEPRKGQALIWCANLLRGGSPQVDPRLTRWSQVTHYFFDDCIYYTPAFSDEALGRLQLRNLVSICDGAARPSTYLGEPVLPCRPQRGRALCRRIANRVTNLFTK